MKYFVDQKGQKIEAAYIDGYNIAERLLEGVMIEMTFSDKGKLQASFQQKDQNYVEDLNIKNFLKLAKETAQEYLDEGKFEMLCDAKGQPIDRIEDDDPNAKIKKKPAKPKATSILLKTSSIDDVMNAIMTSQSKPPKI